LQTDTRASTENGACDWQSAGVCLYLPSRSAQVYALVEQWDVPEPDAWGVHYDNDYGYGSDDYDTGGGGRRRVVLKRSVSPAAREVSRSACDDSIYDEMNAEKRHETEMSKRIANPSICRES
jgi:hypothetical protein